MIMMTIIATGVCITSCKAWRTISTTATYVQKQDSVQTLSLIHI